MTLTFHINLDSIFYLPDWVVHPTLVDPFLFPTAGAEQAGRAKGWSPAQALWAGFFKQRDFFERSEIEIRCPRCEAPQPTNQNNDNKYPKNIENNDFYNDKPSKSDNDNLTDGTEDANHNGRIDGDNGDGTYQTTETWTETNPDEEDTDGDTFNDGDEKSWGYNPLSKDTDGDGLNDNFEDSSNYGTKDSTETSVTDSDTDGDGLSDKIEIDGWRINIIHQSTLKILNSYMVFSDPHIVDTDYDGVLDSFEYENLSAPNSTDTDQDGLSDYQELVINNVNEVNIIESNPPIIESIDFSFEDKLDLLKMKYETILTIDLVVEDDSGVNYVSVLLFGSGVEYEYCNNQKHNVIDFSYSLDPVDTIDKGLLGWSFRIFTEDVNSNIGLKVIKRNGVIDDIKEKIIGKMDLIINFILVDFEKIYNYLVDQIINKLEYFKQKIDYNCYLDIINIISSSEEISERNYLDYILHFLSPFFSVINFISNLFFPFKIILNQFHSEIDFDMIKNLVLSATGINHYSEDYYDLFDFNGDYSNIIILVNGFLQNDIDSDLSNEKTKGSDEYSLSGINRYEPDALTGGYGSGPIAGLINFIAKLGEILGYISVGVKIITYIVAICLAGWVGVGAVAISLVMELIGFGLGYLSGWLMEKIYTNYNSIDHGGIGDELYILLYVAVYLVSWILEIILASTMGIILMFMGLPNFVKNFVFMVSAGKDLEPDGLNNDQEKIEWKILIDGDNDMDFDCDQIDNEYSLFRKYSTDTTPIFSDGYIICNDLISPRQLNHRDPDSDGDGLYDGDELGLKEVETTDGLTEKILTDGRPDYDKDTTYGIAGYGYITSPSHADSDGDGLLDGKSIKFEIDSDLYDSNILNSPETILDNDNEYIIKNGLINSGEINRFKKLQDSKSLLPIRFEEDGKYYILFRGEYSEIEGQSTSPISPDTDNDGTIDGKDIDPTGDNDERVIELTFSNILFVGDLEIIDFLTNSIFQSLNDFSTPQQFFGSSTNYENCGGSNNYLSLTWSNIQEDEDVYLQRMEDANMKIPMMASLRVETDEVNHKYSTVESKIFEVYIHELVEESSDITITMTYPLSKNLLEYYDSEMVRLHIEFAFMGEYDSNKRSDIWEELDVDNYEHEDFDDDADSMRNYRIEISDDSYGEYINALEWYDEDGNKKIFGTLSITGESSNPSTDESSESYPERSLYDLSFDLKIDLGE